MALGTQKLKRTSLRYFDLASILFFSLAVFFFLFIAWVQQNQFIDELSNQTSALAEAVESPLFFMRDDVCAIKIDGEVLLLKDEEEPPAFIREVSLPLSDSGKDIHIVFVHPVLYVLSAQTSWYFFFVFLVIIYFCRAKLASVMSKQLTELETLEEWAMVSEQQGKVQPLLASNIVANTIARLREDLLKAQQNKSLFDQEIKERALLDPKTRIGTRGFFNNHLSALLKEDDSRGAVFLIQLKGCEAVQNLYGDSEAEKLLTAVVNNLKKRLFSVADSVISRRGEFELAILLPNFYVKETEKFAERLLQGLMSFPLPKNVNKDEFCHIGISCFKGAQQSYQVMAEADMALRSAQLQGPAQWFMFDPGEIANESAIGSLRWRTLLTRVIEEKSFIIFSQPVICAETGRILHFEVLSKIRDENGLLINPRIFLPMAEKCGLSGDLDLVVFEQVCQLINFEKEFNYQYSVNFSIDGLMKKSVRKNIYQLLTEYKCEKANIYIEISEYYLKSKQEALLPIIAELRQHGFKIIADKVGQYVVNAEYLKQYHISSVKLHSSIVLDVANKAENQVFIQSMKVLCEPLDIQLIAVGIENVEDWQMLVQFGVCGGQGHLFNEPIAQVANAIALG